MKMFISCAWQKLGERELRFSKNLVNQCVLATYQYSLIPCLVGLSQALVVEANNNPLSLSLLYNIYIICKWSSETPA